MKNTITPKEIKKGMRKGTLKFCGSVTEEQAKTLNKKFKIFITQNTSDLIGDIFGAGNRNVYVYQGVQK